MLNQEPIIVPSYANLTNIRRLCNNNMPLEDAKTEDSGLKEEDHDDDDEDDDEGDDLDDADFMAKVNVYLNTKEESASEKKVLESILRRSSSIRSKSVTFDDEFADLNSDTTKTKQELVSEISRLTYLLRDSEAQVLLEKDKRRKKEKYIFKLAKELKKRNTQHMADEQKLEELQEKKQYLEHHWVLAGKELDQEKILRAKLQKEQESEFERALKLEKEKCDNLRQSFEKQLEEMKSTHSKQCHELGQEILKATLEADRLHSQLLGSPRRSKMFHQRDERGGSFVGLLACLVVVAISILVGVKVDFFTRDSLCAPVMPGRTLGRVHAGDSFQAPWWAPSPYKDSVFQYLCAETTQPPTSLQWLADGHDQKILLTQGPKVVLKRSGLVKVEIYGDHVRTWSNKGLSEDHPCIWHH